MMPQWLSCGGAYSGYNEAILKQVGGPVEVNLDVGEYDVVIYI